MVCKKKHKAMDFDNKKERERTLYTDVDEFIKDWCYTDEAYFDDDLWDDNLEQYTELVNKTDY